MTGNIARNSFFSLFLTLEQINLIFTDNVCIVFIVLTYIYGYAHYHYHDAGFMIFLLHSIIFYCCIFCGQSLFYSPNCHKYSYEIIEIKSRFIVTTLKLLMFWNWMVSTTGLAFMRNVTWGRRNLSSSIAPYRNLSRICLCCLSLELFSTRVD